MDINVTQTQISVTQISVTRIPVQETQMIVNQIQGTQNINNNYLLLVLQTSIELHNCVKSEEGDDTSFDSYSVENW